VKGKSLDQMRESIGQQLKEYEDHFGIINVAAAPTSPMVAL
jgi:hypothetical protein